jgi:hypothetical protein
MKHSIEIDQDGNCSTVYLHVTEANILDFQLILKTFFVHTEYTSDWYATVIEFADTLSIPYKIVARGLVTASTANSFTMSILEYYCPVDERIIIELVTKHLAAC